MDFEKSLKKLEKILDDIENKDLTLDELVDVFEEGNKLAYLCKNKLSDAEKRISLIVKNKKKIKTKKIK
tara:strand:- start:351 stop:557 length:207 start_codon:yes stop_codon:yes gene_type:complete